jgi:hypothetical protein
MSDKPLDQRNLPEADEPEIVVNEYGETRDPAVVVDEANRTVLLTPEETIVVEKEHRIDVVPVNRPRKIYAGMWGQAELITAGLSVLALLTVVLIYVFLVIPANREVEHNRAELGRLQTDLITNQEKYGKITNTETHVADLMTSVERFESTWLPVESAGRASLYQKVNGLIAGHGLVNTTGPDYVPLETLGQDESPKSEADQGRDKYQSIYPGTYVTMTVEGSYQNLRRFIRDIETGGDFLVLTAVELEPSDTQQKTNAQGQPTGDATGTGGNQVGDPDAQVGQTQQGRKGKMHGEVVSLRLEIAAYFRRPNAMPAVAPEQQQ